MIYTDAFFLFFAAFLGGSAFFFLPKKLKKHSYLFVSFGGSFLFSLTLVVTLPHLYQLSHSHNWIAYFVCLGFWMQFLLDFLSQGIAHGHLHNDPSKDHPPLFLHTLGLLIALFIHALLDGLLLGGAEHFMGGHDHHGHSHGALLSGILLHKIPVAFSLVAMLLQKRHSLPTILGYLLLFALASPLGYLLPTLWANSEQIINIPLIACWALAVGNVLHIATTTLAEANPNHHFKPSLVIANLGGAGLALSIAYFH